MSASPSPLPANDTDLLSSVFDALPIAAFVVDQEFCVVDFNLAGAKLLDRVPFALLRLRGGEQVQCIHSNEDTDGHTSGACDECVTGNFVREVFAEGLPVRKTGRIRLTRAGKESNLDFVVTVAPILDEQQPLALLVLDDAGELSKLVESRTKAGLASSSPDSTDHATVPVRRTGNS